MDYFSYHNGRLQAEDVDLGDIAERFGTPCYVYSRATLERHWQVFGDCSGFSGRYNGPFWPQPVMTRVQISNSNRVVIRVLMGGHPEFVIPVYG